MLRIAQRCCLGINCLLPLANICVTKHAQPLSVGGHDSVFDSIVNHLDEVASPIGTAVQVAELRCVFEVFELLALGASSAMVLSTTPAGTINQTARGFLSFLMKSASEEDPIAFSPTNSTTAFDDMSKTTPSWPAFKSRLTMLAPILPSPIIPSCIITSLLFVICSLLGAGFLKDIHV